VVEKLTTTLSHQPTNKTHSNEDPKNNKDFQSKVVNKNPLLKKWNQHKFFKDQLESGDMGSIYKEG
jgi:hypothetical protein